MTPRSKRYACWALTLSLLFTQSAMSMTMAMQMVTAPANSMHGWISVDQSAKNVPFDAEGAVVKLSWQHPVRLLPDDQGFKCSASGSCCSISSLSVWFQDPLSLPSGVSDYRVWMSNYQVPPLLHPPQ
jgi:hypothetical protein